VVVTQRYLQLLVLCNAWRRSHDAQEMTQVGSSITTHEMSLRVERAERVERVERGIRRFDDSTILVVERDPMVCHQMKRRG
jgi:hypothetical protein